MRFELLKPSETAEQRRYAAGVHQTSITLRMSVVRKCDTLLLLNLVGEASPPPPPNLAADCHVYGVMWAHDDVLRRQDDVIMHKVILLYLRFDSGRLLSPSGRLASPLWMKNLDRAVCLLTWGLQCTSHSNKTRSHSGTMLIQIKTGRGRD